MNSLLRRMSVDSDINLSATMPTMSTTLDVFSVPSMEEKFSTASIALTMISIAESLGSALAILYAIVVEESSMIL